MKSKDDEGVSIKTFRASITLLFEAMISIGINANILVLIHEEVLKVIFDLAEVHCLGNDKKTAELLGLSKQAYLQLRAEMKIDRKI